MGKKKDKVRVQEDEYRTITPEEMEYTRDNPLTVKLSQKLKVSGVFFDYLRLQPPTRGQLASARDKAMVEGKRKGLKDNNGRPTIDGDTLFTALLPKICMEPQISPDDVDELSAADFAYIAEKIQEAGFFGTIKKTT